MFPNIKLYLVGFLVSLLASTIRCEIFSAIESLEILAVNETAILKELEKFASKVDDDYINRKLKAWQEEHKLVEKDVIRYITNPLNAFLIIKRATADIETVKKRFGEDSKEFSEAIKEFQPDEADLVGAVEGLLRLQTVYRLKSEDFANGIIDGVKTRSTLTPHDVFIIGREAFNLSGEDYFAKEYFNLALKMVKEGKDVDNEVDESDLLDCLTTSYNRTGDYENALKTIEILISKYSESKELIVTRDSLIESNKKHGKKNFKQQDPFSDHFIKNGKYGKIKEAILFSRVCRGNLTKTLLEQSQLHCRYLSNSPFSKLARFRVEEANLDPYLIVFYDVLSDSDILILQNRTRPIIKRAMTLGNKLEIETSKQRTAQTSFHKDRDHGIFVKISQRVEDMTGLSQKYAEGLQVQNYGIGGHYSAHWDHTIKTQPPFDGRGNRIATVLFYLSNVEKGGSTIFPYLRTKIIARKGTAAFWFNLKPSGEGNFLTKHAACPVLLGSKWVANRWIREQGNEFRRPCPPETFVEDTEHDLYRDFF